MSDQKVSIRRIIGNVVDKLQLEDVSSRITAFAGWAVDAELKIGSKNSYEKVECEIEVKNYRACLPVGFVHLIALKDGGDHLEVTKKDFTHFHKGVTRNIVDLDKKTTPGGEVKLSVEGVPNVHQINFGGTFSGGDNIVVTVANDNCGNVSSNIYNYTVQAGDTLTDIVNEFVTQINTVNPPYTASPGSDYFQIVADTPLINLVVSTSTTSDTGIISSQLIQKRILPQEGSSQEGDNCEVPIKKGSENLAERNTAYLNDGITDDSLYGGAVSIYENELGYGTRQSSKYSISNGYIHFSSKKDGKVGISYMSIATDEEGWPLISATHEDAVTQYLMWQSQIGDYTRGKVPRHVYKELENRWIWLCGQARGDDELPNEDDLQYHANAWNQLLPLPNKNFF